MTHNSTPPLHSLRPPLVVTQHDMAAPIEASANPQHATTGLTDSTHSSSASSSAERYNLNDSDEKPILLYKYRGGLQTSSQKDLCAWLDSAYHGTDFAASGHVLTNLAEDENLRVTKKSIPRLSSYVDVKRHDLFLEGEKELYSSQPNYDSSLASIKIPSGVYWSRLFTGGYGDLYIVSPEGTPNSSLADSSSRKSNSPTSSWGPDSVEDARGGAAPASQ